jgi:hypothetical protein
VRHLDAAKGFLLGALDDLQRSGIENVFEGKDTPPESSAIMRVLTLAERKLRKAIRGRPEREREVQDAFETLLWDLPLLHVAGDRVRTVESLGGASGIERSPDVRP